MYLSILAEDKAEPHITALLLESSVISLCFPVVRGIHAESLGFQVQRCLFNFFKSYLFLSGGAESLLLAQLFSSCSARASHWGGFSCCRAPALGIRALVAVTHGPSCYAACGIFPERGSNLWPPNWQMDPQPLDHQGSSPSAASRYFHDLGQVFLSSSPHPSQYSWLDTHFGFEK